MGGETRPDATIENRVRIAAASLIDFASGIIDFGEKLEKQGHRVTGIMVQVGGIAIGGPAIVAVLSASAVDAAHNAVDTAYSKIAAPLS